MDTITKDDHFDWTPEEAGTYTFEVVAIDRDLNYSEPARMTLEAIESPYQEDLRRTREELEVAYRDLAERNAQLQAAKATAEAANRAKSLFLANMSHEIRTPLNAILGYAQILQDKVNAPEEVRAGLNSIFSSGTNLLALIDDVLDIARIEADRGELQPPAVGRKTRRPRKKSRPIYAEIETTE